MVDALQPILSYSKGMGWRGRVITSLVFLVATDVVYEVYLRVSKLIRKKKSEKPFCVVRFMNRVKLTAVPANLGDLRYANVNYLISYIDRAQRTICLSMYILTLKEVCDALIRARKQRNVVVRAIGCESMVYNEGSQLRRLDEDCFLRFRIDSGYLMHHKFCLLDIEWLCAKCLVAEHNLLEDPSQSADFQSTRFDRAVIDDMDGLEKAFGNSCRRCDPSKQVSVASSISDPLPEGGCLITGSSNWTLPALTSHWDSMIFTSLPVMVRPFAVEFQREWYELGDHDKFAK